MKFCRQTAQFKLGLSETTSELKSSWKFGVPHVNNPLYGDYLLHLHPELLSLIPLHFSTIT
jgi:hypothetical protein